MKILAIQSSNKPDGYTGRLAKAVLEGAAEAGGARATAIETEWINLNDHDIQVCRSHGEHGWGVCRQGQPCVLKDGFEALHQKMIEADAIVFATPVYFWDLSESARTFLDRVRRVEWPLREAGRLRGKPIVGVACAGGSGTGSPSAIKNLESYATYMGMNHVAYIPVSRQNFEMQMRTCKEAGKHLVSVVLG